MRVFYTIDLQRKYLTINKRKKQLIKKLLFTKWIKYTQRGWMASKPKHQTQDTGWSDGGQEQKGGN